MNAEIKQKKNFWDICNDPNYFELDGNTKIFFICLEEGFVSKDSEDLEQTKYLDMHCKCGAPMIIEEFDRDKLFEMYNAKIEADMLAEHWQKVF